MRNAMNINYDNGLKIYVIRINEADGSWCIIFSLKSANVSIGEKCI